MVDVIDCEKYEVVKCKCKVNLHSQFTTAVTGSGLPYLAQLGLVEL